MSNGSQFWPSSTSRHSIRTDAANFEVSFVVGQTGSRNVTGIIVEWNGMLNWVTELILIFYRQTHDDYRGLERAKEAMVDVAQYTNEVKRDSEHLVVIQKVKVS